jgi:hypothetical protein
MGQGLTTKKLSKRDAHLVGAMRAVCELMRANGTPRRVAEKRLLEALVQGYSVQSTTGQESQRFTRLCDVCARWHLEKDFVDARGKPRPLVWNGKSGSLRRLVTRVVGPRDSLEVIHQLKARRLIKRTARGEWLPKSRVVAPVGMEDAQIARTAAMIGRLLRTIIHNSRLRYQGDVLMEVMAQVPRLPRSRAHGFRRFAKAQGVSFIKTIDDWLESRSLRRLDRRREHTLEAGVVAFAFHQQRGE